MEIIDYFKYKALLGELELLKSNQKHTTYFINKLYKLSDQLYTAKENAESLRYYFMLITRAVEYNIASRKCTRKVKDSLEYIAKYLTHNNLLTPENILETYEFWKLILEFSPDTLTDLLYIEKLAAVVYGIHSINVSVYSIKEIEILNTYYRPIVKLFLLNTIGPDSYVSKHFKTTDSFDTSKIISAAEESISNLQILLKETYEQHSRGITTI